ncbi:MAG: CHASE2 domain-containing protein [Sphingobacteriales bacterium]|nr:CHASE2 domain-containing protein [Sphingobacteriales bacterium]
MKKPLHQHIGHHARRVGRHVTKYLYKRDTLFSTVWVFVFIIVLGSIPVNFYFLNPLKLALKDFDFHDMAHAKLHVYEDRFDRRITIVNIGMADREQLAALIDKTAEMKPRVMGLDVLLEGPKDPYKDSVLAATVSRCANLVLASRLEWKDEKDPYKENFFRTPGTGEGYANMLAEDIATVRLWAPFFENEKDSHAKPYKSFASSILEKYDSTAFKRLVKRNKETETINYSRRQDRYYQLEGESILAGLENDSLIRDRIILFGYIGADESDILDKKFTPMNKKYYGKSIPDMNGVAVHANMLSMALDNHFIRKMPGWFNWLLAILIGWIHMAIFIKYYIDHHIWFHLVAKIAQLLSAIFFVYLDIWLYEKYRVKLDMKMTLIVIVMAVDVIYFYEAWATWMHRRFKYRTVFGHHGTGH